MDKTKERILNRLEKTYSKNEAHHRVFFKDRADILALYKDGDIDAEHRDILLNRAQEAYQSAKDKLKPVDPSETELTPLEALQASFEGVSVTRAYADTKSALGAVIGLVFMFLVAIPLFFT